LLWANYLKGKEGSARQALAGSAFVVAPADAGDTQGSSDERRGSKRTSSSTEGAGSAKKKRGGEDNLKELREAIDPLEKSKVKNQALLDYYEQCAARIKDKTLTEAARRWCNRKYKCLKGIKQCIATHHEGSSESFFSAPGYFKPSNYKCSICDAGNAAV
jgi:hypothetical protein